MKNIKHVLIQSDCSIINAMKIIQEGAIGIALIVNEQGHLLSTLTDGDIRRAILNKIDLENKVSCLSKYKPSDYPDPVVAHIGTSKEKLIEIMRERVLRHIPLIDEKGRVKEIVLLSDLVQDKFLDSFVTTVVMAGGEGKRLHPLTKNVPKPMLPLNGEPLMKHTIEKLREGGIKKIQISTRYKSEIIKNYFGNGSKFGIDINYVDENRPLGTAGALGLMDVPSGTVLIINGDILTQLNFEAMYDFHHSHHAMMTVGLSKYEFQVPYGVVQTEDVVIKSLVEKPKHTFFVLAGIYLLEPLVYEYIPKGQRFDMTDLINCLLKAKERVISFPIQEYWLDIGLHNDYKQAVEDFENGRI